MQRHAVAAGILPGIPDPGRDLPGGRVPNPPAAYFLAGTPLSAWRGPAAPPTIKTRIYYTPIGPKCVPLIADAAGEQTKATTAPPLPGEIVSATNSGGRCEKIPLSIRPPISLLFAKEATNSVTPSEAVGPASTLLTVIAVPARLGNPRPMAIWAALVIP